MDLRQKALADFLNDMPEKIELGFYQWRGHCYQVLPYKKIKTRVGKGHNVNQFVILTYRNKLYGVRELSQQMLLKLCKKIKP